MKICVLQPSYGDSSVDYANYDPPRDLSDLYESAQVDHVFLDKRTTYAQIKALSRQGYDIFVNLCEGYLDWDIPSVDVIHALESLKLPHTGPSSELFDPSKELMKYVAYTANVNTPAYCVVEDVEELEKHVEGLNYPLFVKPAHAGDSLGIDESSKVYNFAALKKKSSEILADFGRVLIEEFIEGREFTVLVAADPKNPNACMSFKPIEYCFGDDLDFKTYALKTSDLHPKRNVPCEDKALEKRLRQLSEAIFLNFNGKGYARMDLRMDAQGDIYFLEVNFTCSVFYRNGYEGSADFILQADGIGASGFLKLIIEEGIARHQRNKPVFEMRGNAAHGYGIYSNRPIKKGEVVFAGEGRKHRPVTQRFVKLNPHLFDPLTVRRYAYPLSSEVFLIWSDNPSDWAPQNHSCDPNCAFLGLDVIAKRDIEKSEELTLDYAEFLDDGMEPFACNCQSRSCRGVVKGTPGNSITARESILRKKGKSKLEGDANQLRI